MDEPSKLERAFVALVERSDPLSLRRRRTFVIVLGVVLLVGLVAFIGVTLLLEGWPLDRGMAPVTVMALWAVAMCGQTYNQLTLLQGAVEHHRRNRAL